MTDQLPVSTKTTCPYCGVGCGIIATRDKNGTVSVKGDPDHPANFVMMMCVGMNDPGMIVQPTHRLFRGIPPLSTDEIVKRLGECFTTRVAGEGIDLAEAIWTA